MTREKKRVRSNSQRMRKKSERVKTKGQEGEKRESSIGRNWGRIVNVGKQKIEENKKKRKN